MANSSGAQDTEFMTSDGVFDGTDMFDAPDCYGGEDMADFSMDMSAPDCPSGPESMDKHPGSGC